MAKSERETTMKAMLLEQPGTPLRQAELPVPRPGPHQVLLRVLACGVCRTDLHLVDGELPAPLLPLVPGHEIVGEVVACGPLVEGWRPGQKLGVPWLGQTCGFCRFCRTDRENLCGDAAFTGCHMHGGYAEYALADGRYCLPIPDAYPPAQAAPLLCAGLIGYRALTMAGPGQRLGLYGFGAAAHIVIQVARHQGREVYAFTRPGDDAGQAFARSLGAVWAGGSDQLPPVPLEAALLFAPAGHLVPASLAAVDRGGVVVCAGIQMTDIPSFPYSLLWGERSVRSVANLTRRDGREFLAVAARLPVRTVVECFALQEANKALHRLRNGEVTGAAVLVPGDLGEAQAAATRSRPASLAA